MLKFFATPATAHNNFTVTINTDLGPNIVTITSPTQLGQLIVWALDRGYTGDLTNGLEWAWVQQVIENVRGGYRYGI